MFSKERKVVTRFAPSPTGFMHVGGVRTALYSYLFARKHGGEFILRIEDTDKARQVEGSIEHIQETLKWLGLDWDYGPDKPGDFGSCIQSERLETYLTFARKLVAKGLAYPDPYTPEELQAFREEAKRENRPFLFRDHRPEEMGEWDEKSTLRFKVPDIRRYEWHDEVRGDLDAGEEALDDFVLMKADGYPTYNFAHIVDDFHMGVTHIMRADEFISSTPRFLSLYEALDIEPPKFVTLPPILGTDRKKKLGKRDGAKDVMEYQEEGYLPEAFLNFLALIGWNPGTDQEIFTKEELIEAFDLDGIQTGGGAFNEEKLQWTNREHLLRLSDKDFRDFVDKWLPEDVRALPQFSEERLMRLLPVIRERVHTGRDIETAAQEGEYDFAFTQPTVEREMLKWKNDDDVKDALPRLQKVAEMLASLPEESFGEAAKEVIWPYAEKVGKGEVLWPLRVALSGRERSPDPFAIIDIIGTAEAYARVQRAVNVLLNA
ncbi:glutamate--tRNA ligase [Candidatus Kaiserbacteria bacterium]|nr:glutamate--tRNA ligase [Candidatus Kaiserbacteria bacterium]